MAISRNRRPDTRTCFVAGTNVKTPSGYRTIEDIRAGDEVLSYNEHTKRLETHRVKQTFIRKTDRIYTLVYDTGTKLQTTATHPFYIEGKGWVKAADLHVGDDSLLSREVSQLDVYGGMKLTPVAWKKPGVVTQVIQGNYGDVYANFVTVQHFDGMASRCAHGSDISKRTFQKPRRRLRRCGTSRRILRTPLSGPENGPDEKKGGMFSSLNAGGNEKGRLDSGHRTTG